MTAPLSSTHPDIAATLDAARSGFTAEEVVAGSNRVGFWWCPEHPEIPFRAKVAQRTRGQGCRICAGRQVVAGYNDLATTHPAIAATLLAEESGFDATQVAAGSGRAGLWRCPAHPQVPFRARVVDRIRGQACGICTGRQVVAGYNDLATTHPAIAATLLAEESGFDATQVVAGSGRIGYWHCPIHPHFPFRAAVDSRTREVGCGICAGRQVVAGYNDLATTHPAIAVLLDPERSGFTARQVTAGSSRTGWWRRGLDSVQVVRQPVFRMTRRARPARDRRPRKRLAVTHPEIAATLDAERSGFAATEVTAGSGRIGWWICDAHPGIPYKATVNQRTRGQGCGICAGYQIVAGHNDLATTHPAIAATLLADQSGFDATQVTAGSGRTGQWWCPEHPSIPFTARVAERSRGCGCGICAGYQIVAGHNDLATTHPAIAATLLADQSGFDATQVTAGSSRTGLWWCPEHPDIPFTAKVNHRARGQRCTTCTHRGHRVTTHVAGDQDASVALASHCRGTAVPRPPGSSRSTDAPPVRRRDRSRRFAESRPPPIASAGGLADAVG